MTKKWFWLSIVIGVIVFVGGPLFIQYNHWPRGSNGNGDWLSFWGSYLGVVPSGIIAFVVAKYQIDRDEIRRKNLDKHLLYVNNLSSINVKLRKLDSVFEYGITNRYLLNDEFKNIGEVGVAKDDNLKSRMEMLSDYLHKRNVFSLLDELLLDIDMMSKVRGTAIQDNVKSLKSEMNKTSVLFSDLLSDIDKTDYGRTINTRILEHYRNSYDLYHETLEIIAEEIYGDTNESA